MVAGVESLSLAMPAISEIGSMGSSDAYSEAALVHENSLCKRVCRVLSCEDRTDAAKNLSVSDETKTTREVEELLADHIPGSMFSSTAHIDCFLKRGRSLSCIPEPLPSVHCHRGPAESR
jgi:hypothetical protein